MIQRHLPALAVALPLAVAALLAATRQGLPRRVLDGTALAVALAVAAACATLAAHPAAARAYWFGGWRPGTGPALGIAFAPDAAGATFAAFAATLVALAVVFAASMFEPERGIFHVLVLVFLAGMVGFSLTADLFDLFVFFELMGVAAFALTGWHADERGPLQGMMTFAVTNAVGAMLFLLGTGLLYGRTGALNLASIGRALAGGRADGLVVAAFALLAAGFLVKLAAFPFHFWLPDAHAVAPAPVCALFSGVMVPLGAFGLARVHAAAFQGVLPAGSTAGVFAAIAAATAVVGGAMALVQQHLKRLLAFSTVAHAGTILAGVAAANPQGLAAAGLHAFGHGVLKLALFMCAGALLDRFGTVDVRRLRGRGREVPELAVVWAFAAAGLLDLGPTPTGPAAHLLEEAARAAGVEWIGRALAVATALAGAALLRAGAQVFLGAG
ncbi:MAG TPA: complex I subunit 5 family protein, partial [Anaeromyxobacter sp.]